MSDGGVCVWCGAWCGVWRVACGVRRVACGVRVVAQTERRARAAGRREAQGQGRYSTALLLYYSYCSRAAHLDAAVACDGDGAEHLTRRVLPRLERAVHALCGVDAARLVKGRLGVGLELG